MESVLGRYRNLVILVGVLFLQVLGLATQVKRGGGNDAEGTRLIRIWVVGAISPFQRGVLAVENGVGNLWHNYFYLRGVRAENRELKQQIEQMHLEQVRLSEDAAQARRLQSLLAFKEQFIAHTVAAQVIGTSGSDLSRSVYIDKGESAGIKRDMSVITADGIVGKVLIVYPNVSQILLINDQSSGVGAILEKSRLQGVLRGTASGEVMLERVMSDEQVQPGETVLTSGGDQIFPKGLPVGTVSRVGEGKDLFLSIRVKPAANLSKLEEVLVVTEKQEREAVADDSRVRAADILAARLPSVPDKPADATSTSAAASGAAQPGVSSNGAASVPPASNKPAASANHGTPVAGQTAATPGMTTSAQKPVSTATASSTKPASTPTKPATASQKPASSNPPKPTTSKATAPASTKTSAPAAAQAAPIPPPPAAAGSPQ